LGVCDLALTSIKIGPSADSLLSKWGTTRALGTLSGYATPLIDEVTTLPEHLSSLRKVNQRNPQCQNVTELTNVILEEWWRFPQQKRLRRLVREAHCRGMQHHWSMRLLPFRSTWVHSQFLVGLLLLDLRFYVYVL
jgi:hypothetical protein